jgi:putative membrane protein
VNRALSLLVGAGALALVLALTAATGGRLTSYTGPLDAATRPPSEWWALWVLPPLELAAIAVLGVSVARVGRTNGGFTARRRGYLAAALAVLVISVCSPLGGLAQAGILSAHMFQHTLIGGFAPLLILLSLPRGLTIPTRGFFATRLWRGLSQPIVAFCVWVASTLVWLVPDLHHAVLSHQSLWFAQQLAFFGFGTLLWAPIVDRLTTSPTWFGTSAKCVYMTGVWFTGLGIANVFWFSGYAFYSSHAVAAKVWGLDPLQDQANAGTVMMLVHCFLAFGAIAVLFFRSAREGALEQRLIEAGLEPGRISSALRRGELDDLARATGVSLRSRPGMD